MSQPAIRASKDEDRLACVLDVLIVGAGIAGIYQLYRLTERGLDVRVLDAAHGVGGTWYWNRYPGCRFDSESYSYGYFFSDELLQGWSWTEVFATQPEIERYLNLVVDKFDLRSSITLDTTVQSARFDDRSSTWTVTDDQGRLWRTRFLITALGMLSEPQYPPVEDRSKFRGPQYHTARWPEQAVQFTGRRVAVVGTGSSGVQIISSIRHEVSEMFVFQRTPNWCAPLNNRIIDSAETSEIKRNLPAMHDLCMTTPMGFVHQPESTSAWDHSATERLAFYEDLWARPGFAKVASNYPELATDPVINTEFCEFVEGKIRARVTDQAVADLLVPRDHGYGGKRPPFEIDYFEAFNQDNVELIDLTQTPLVKLTSAGLRTTAAEYPADIVVWATGFDAITGAYDKIDIRGLDDRSLFDLWLDGPRTHLGIQSPGFPNLFFLSGPHGTSGNMPRCIEVQVDFVTALLDHARDNGATRVSCTSDAEEIWTRHVMDTASRAASDPLKDWKYGANTPGKKIIYRAYAGGLDTYRSKCAEVINSGFEGVVFSA